MEAVTDTVLQYGIEIVMLAIFAGFGFIAKKVNDRAKDVDQKEKEGKDLTTLDKIDRLAKRSVEFAENEFDGFLGSDKFGEATQKLSELANNYDIPLTESMLVTSTQNAWRSMDTEQRQNGVKDDAVDDDELEDEMDFEENDEEE